jgi:hypothetical protein
MSAIPLRKQVPPIFLLIFCGSIALIGYRLVSFSISPPVSEFIRQNKTEKEGDNGKSSGKNGKHANQKARESAGEKLDKAEKELEALRRKSPKSNEDKKAMEKLVNEIKHWRNKKNWTGETHSIKSKGK